MQIPTVYLLLKTEFCFFNSSQQSSLCVSGVETSLRVTTCKQIVESLPEHNFIVLKYLVAFLHMVGAHTVSMAVYLNILINLLINFQLLRKLKSLNTEFCEVETWAGSWSGSLA